MTEAQRLEMREAAREILKEVGPDIAREAAWRVINEHIQSCPVQVRTDAKLKVMTVIGVVSIILGIAAGNAAIAIIGRLIAL